MAEVASSSSSTEMPGKNTPQWHLQEAEVLKDQGNNFYKDQAFPSAIKQYHLCLLQVRAVQNQMKMSSSSNSLSALANESQDNNNDQQMSPDEKKRVKEQADGLAVKCYNNLAACILNKDKKRTKQDYLRAVSYCDKVLEIEEKNEKAQFRRGEALMEAGEQEKAIEQLQAVEEKNAQAKVLIARCRKELDLERKQRDEIIKQNFMRAQQRERMQPQHNAAADHAATSNGDMAHSDESTERLLPNNN